MLLLGYFEGIDSDRGNAWRCADSLSVRSFLGLPLTAKTPDHSSLSRIRQRLTPEVHEAVFKFVLQVLSDHDLLDTEENIRKRYIVLVAGFNLGIVMRKLHGAGRPRGMAALKGRVRACLGLLEKAMARGFGDGLALEVRCTFFANSTALGA
jgi:hypothetical protein